jgi:hypothetical protein
MVARLATRANPTEHPGDAEGDAPGRGRAARHSAGTGHTPARQRPKGNWVPVATQDAVATETQSPLKKKGPRSAGAFDHFLLRRWWRVLRRSLRCFFFAMRLRRFLMTEPMVSSWSWSVLPDGATNQRTTPNCERHCSGPRPRNPNPRPPGGAPRSWRRTVTTGRARRDSPVTRAPPPRCHANRASEGPQSAGDVDHVP